MSANAIAKRDDEIVVTNDQLELVRKTVAQGASDAQLKLFLYDCQRRGVHPLDRLLHFTLRGGKYVPIVSIDLMRSRAAETCEYAGNDDAEFEGIAKTDSFSARVTVYRLVQGQRCAFSATARWSEYCPPSGQDTMWKKMPHTMLAKVAESLALRKGFPQQIGGLYSGEEMAQAGEDERMGQSPLLRSPASPDEQCETTGRQPVSGSQSQPQGKPALPNQLEWITGKVGGIAQACQKRFGFPVEQLDFDTAVKWIAELRAAK
jgi:phage recombination protein Bet